MSDPHIHLLLTRHSKDEVYAIIRESFKVPITDAHIEAGLDASVTLNATQLAGLVQGQERFCTRCGWCCENCTPVDVTKSDLKAIAKHLKTPYKKLKKRLRLRRIKDVAQAYKMKAAPCTFYDKGKGCTVYPVRPNTCRLYPLGMPAINAHLGKKVEIANTCGAVEEMFRMLVVAHISMTLAVEAGVMPDFNNPENIEQLRAQMGIQIPDLKTVINQKLDPRRP